MTDTTETSLRFTSITVPKAIQQAAMRIGAYFIYKAVFMDQRVENSSRNIAFGLLEDGMNMISAYVSKFNLALHTSAPILGYQDSNKPVDLDNDFLFKSSQ